jgi:hypothetical protein
MAPLHYGDVRENEELISELQILPSAEPHEVLSRVLSPSPVVSTTFTQGRCDGRTGGARLVALMAPLHYGDVRDVAGVSDAARNEELISELQILPSAEPHEVLSRVLSPSPVVLCVVEKCERGGCRNNGTWR